MKQLFLKKLMIAAFMLCTVPAALFAQTEKEKTKDKNNRQQIIITRTGDTEEKTVIEINGDKVKVNGKDAAGLKDIQVHVNTMKGANVMALQGTGRNNLNMSFDNEISTIFSEDANRAMLGVVTDGDDKGVRIETINKESAADKAGLKKNDIITKIDNKKIDATGDVTEAVRSHKPGDKISITYLRDGKEEKATAELGKWKGMKFNTFTAPKGFNNQLWSGANNNSARALTIPRVQMNGDAFGFSNRPKLGLSVQDTDDGKGVKVLEVDDDSNAAKAGIRENDIITSLDDIAVNSADEISGLIKDKKDKNSVKVQLTREGKPQTVEIRMPRKIKTVDL